MSTTANFALRTFPEFKEAAKALANTPPIYERHASAEGEQRFFHVSLYSINGAFNTLIAKGMPAMLSLIEAELTRKQATLEITQDIMRFLLANPAARRAYATNFPEDSGARRVIEASDAGRREAEENDGGIVEAGQALSDAEEVLFQDIDESEDGISRPAAASLLARRQDEVVRLAEAQGALQRALMTQGDAGSHVPD